MEMYHRTANVNSTCSRVNNGQSKYPSLNRHNLTAREAHKGSVKYADARLTFEAGWQNLSVLKLFAVSRQVKGETGCKEDIGKIQKVPERNKGGNMQGTENIV